MTRGGAMGGGGAFAFAEALGGLASLVCLRLSTHSVCVSVCIQIVCVCVCVCVCMHLCTRVCT